MGVNHTTARKPGLLQNINYSLVQKVCDIHKSGRPPIGQCLDSPSSECAQFPSYLNYQKLNDGFIKLPELDIKLLASQKIFMRVANIAIVDVLAES